MSSQLRCKPLEPGLNISVNVTDVSFNNSFWIVMDMNITFMNSNIANLSILVQKKSSTTDIFLNVIESQVGSQIILKDTAARLEKCQSVPKRVQQTKPSIELNNSTITVKSSYFEHFCSAFILNASVAHFSNVKFVKCVSTMPLIIGTNQNTLCITNCTFLSNIAPLLSLQHMSVGSITNSTITNNSFWYSWLHPAPGLISSSVSLLCLEMAHFSKNKVENGSVIGLWNKSVGIILSSEVSDNVVGGDYAAISVMPSGSVKIDGSKFMWNKGGAVLITNGVVVVTKNCLFLGNSAFFGAAMYMQIQEEFAQKCCTDINKNWILSHQNQIKKDIMKYLLDDDFMPLATQEKIIYNCTFASNSALFGAGAVFAGNLSLLLLKNSFVNNTATNPYGDAAGGGAVFLLHSNSIITNCTFEGNQAFAGGAIFADDTTLSIQSSNFSKNHAVADNNASLATGGAIYALSDSPGNVTSVFSQCIFDDNQASEEGGAVASVVFIKIEKSTFNRNRAIYGGAISCSFVVIKSCKFDANTGEEGGALRFYKQTVISHTNFTQNLASAGGAILAEIESSLSCIFCSFDGNTAGFR